MNKFFKNNGPYKIEELAKLIGATIIGNATKNITAVKSLSEADIGDITCFNNKKYLPEFKTTKAAACIVDQEGLEELNPGLILLKVDNAYFAYSKILDLFYAPIYERKKEAHPSAVIDPTAKIGENCYIGPNVVIEAGAELGKDCLVEAGSYIGPNVVIGDRARIDSNVNITHSIIGNDVVILPGASIGQDGFGFATHHGKHKKLLHIGCVMIGNDVEIGANTTIDRGSMSNTIIEDRCRIDNLVQIGHNVHIKTGSVIVAQVGIAGSSQIGQYCVLGGQVGVAGHIKMADQVQVAAQSGVARTVTTPKAAIGGTPAVPIRDWHKQTLVLQNLIKK